MGFARVAGAQAAVAQRSYVVKDDSATTGLDRPLSHSGIWVLGLSYVPAVVEPWLDLAARSSCSAHASCNDETVNGAFLVVEGVLQGFGALDIVGAFVFPETRTVTVGSSDRGAARRSSASIRFLPARVGGNAYGVAAVSSF
jgi:hypothetical protein